VRKCRPARPRVDWIDPWSCESDIFLGIEAHHRASLVRVGTQSRVPHPYTYVVFQGFCDAESSRVLGTPGLGTRHPFSNTHASVASRAPSPATLLPHPQQTRRTRLSQVASPFTSGFTTGNRGARGSEGKAGLLSPPLDELWASAQPSRPLPWTPPRRWCPMVVATAGPRRRQLQLGHRISPPSHQPEAWE
jgi:hypothetical protein